MPTDLRRSETGRPWWTPLARLVHREGDPGSRARSYAAAPQEAGKIQPPYTNLPEREQRLHRWAESLPALEDAESSQKDWSAESMALFHSNTQEGILGDMPVAVLTQGYQQSRRSRGLSKHGVQVIVQGGHNMHLENPDAVVSAIRGIFETSVKSAGSRAQ
jgi:hypothetical protein